MDLPSYPQLGSQPKGILFQFPTPLAKMSIWTKLSTSLVSILKITSMCIILKKNNFFITFLRLHSTIANCKVLPCQEDSLFPHTTPSLLSTEPLIRASHRVLSDLHNYLNPQNNRRGAGRYSSVVGFCLAHPRTWVANTSTKRKKKKKRKLRLRNV